MNQITETTEENWFSRIATSLKSVVAGIVLIAISFVILFVNEGCSARNSKLMSAARDHVVSIAGTSVSDKNNGKLIHMRGPVTTEDVLSDPQFGVSKRAVKLLRTVETYQWEQTSESTTKKKVGGGQEKTTTYTYKPVWSQELIDSSRFKDQSGKYHNPATRAFSSQEFVARQVNLGEFLLSQELINQYGGYAKIGLTEEDGKNLPNHLRRDVKIQNDFFFIGRNPLKPEIGDSRVSFLVAEPATASVMAEQAGEKLGPFSPADVDGKIERIEMGSLSSDAMLSQWSEENAVMTWLIRVGGFALMLIGLSMIFNPLVVVADVVPIFGDLLSVGLFAFSGLMAFLLSVLTISIAWLFYRPLWASVAILCVVAGFYGFKRYSQIAAQKSAAMTSA